MTTAHLEREHDVNVAINTRDSEALYNLASYYKKEGEDETADQLLTIAKKIDREDWAYDESIGN